VEEWWKEFAAWSGCQLGLGLEQLGWIEEWWEVAREGPDWQAVPH